MNLDIKQYSSFVILRIYKRFLFFKYLSFEGYFNDCDTALDFYNSYGKKASIRYRQREGC